MAKDIIGTYGKAFETTSNGIAITNRINELDKALATAKKPYRIAYKKDMAKIESDRVKYGWNCGQVNAQYEYARSKALRGIRNDETVQKILAEIESVKAERETAIKSFAEKIEGNEAWNRVRTLKATPKILKSLLDGNFTEAQIEKSVFGEVRQKQNRIDWELARMETLGWLVRSGNGTVGDAMLCSITDKGKHQIDFYEKHGMFDASVEVA